MSICFLNRLLLALVFGFFPLTVAQVCLPPLGEYGYSYNATDQSVLDAIAKNCTTINGSIVIATSYTGSFNLPNVRNITGQIGYGWEGTPAVPAPSSISLPDLEYMGSDMYLLGISTLTNVSAPKLRTAGWALRMDYVQNVDLRSLETVRYAEIFGDVSSLRLDSLRNVSGYFSICNKDRCEKNQSSTTPLYISLPSLQSAGSIEIAGSLSGLAVPNLTTIKEEARFAGFQRASSNASAINITFPRLNNAPTYMILGGNISSLSMPEMRNMSGYFRVDAGDSLPIDLPFEEASSIDLYGAISSVKFPKLKSLSSFSVHSSLSLDCQSVKDTITKAKNGSKGYVDCSSKRHSKKLGTGAIAGIVVGVVIGVGLIVVLGALYYIKRRKRREEKPTSNTELNGFSPPRYEEPQAIQVPPPKYSPPLGTR
ncbi:uncharacterized protein BO66DRAFT_395508 [Aspergillus aculeatinus CBS 121060]|uniref:Uncharacterized protein n=1 Tax=Aspergillus aculeatinus CBS 121060 TaxID=1448322 RepID=A0ACD1GVX1_9EURO|nr:hypothetical protein BO66DRAFT_395508 [Aspergillus aculeatinus CBS 121060]RAH65432.1 hypothetical protein BO66DRAFT_395508 [Aspergillus aculeatinus CBS 121060]